MDWRNSGIWYLKFRYSEKLHELHNNLPILPEWMKIEKSWKTCSKLAWQRRIYYTHKKFKTDFKPETNF